MDFEHMNETITSLLNHKSIRRYQEKTIEPEVLDKLLEVGMRAPSSGNLQNFSLLVVDDKEKLALLAEETYAAFVKKAPVSIIALVDYYRFNRLCKMFDAPFHYDNADSIFIGCWDAIVALHNIAVAAESMGLGTCYVGLILQTDNKKIFDLPDYVFAVGMLTIGYPDHEPDFRPRHQMEAIVHKNNYQKFTDEELKEYYENWLLNWDRFYKKLSDEKKKHWNEELGVRNNVQYVTKTVYTEERIKEWSKGIALNLKKAKYKIGYEK
jgi:nitroreductase